MNLYRGRAVAALVALVTAGACLILSTVPAYGQTRAFPKPLLTYPTPMDPDDIAGVVTSIQGPEAGVWVIAESDDPASKFVKIVLTNDQGRYVLPDLPKGSYQVFVRGYGLADSKRSKAWPGQQLFFGVTAAETVDEKKVRPAGEDRNVVVTVWNEGSSAAPKAAGGRASSMSHPFTVPYPAEVSVQTVEEHVDDGAAGWKGVGYWGKAPAMILKIQMRPDPLAR
jgi:hypothetical protein